MMKTLILTFVAIAGIADACHVEGHEARRRRQARQNPDDVVIGFFPGCMTSRTNDTTDKYLDVVTFYVTYSTWYQRSNVICKDDSVECWNNQLTEILQEGSLDLSAAKECTKQLYFYTNYKVEGTTFNKVEESPGYQDTVDDSKCPTRTADKYELCLQSYATQTKSTFSVANFSSVLNFVNGKSKCIACPCTDAMAKNPAFAQYYQDNGLTCDSCWSTRFAAFVDPARIGLKEASAACSATLTDTDRYSKAQPV